MSCAVVALLACGDAPSPRHVDASVETASDDASGAPGDAGLDLAQDSAPLPSDATGPIEVLDDTPGLAARLTALSLAADAPGPLSFVVDVAADDLAFELGDGPSYHRVPAPGDAVGRARVRAAPFTLQPGAQRVLAPGPLLLWAPGAREARLRIEARADDATLLTADVVLGAGSATRLELGDGALTLTLSTRTGATRLAADTRIGLHLDDALPAADLALRVAGPIAVKHYSGARRWLLRAGCDSDLDCAESGANHPCVSRCACTCETVETCDCDFTSLEATMEADAIAAARRILGDDSDAALERVRVHWVFKRSLGGTSHCGTSGELDVSPATWGAFFGHATAAALAINRRLGFRLIDVLSPMNEANHPLQDGAHVNAAGQPTLGGFLPFAELIRQASCAADGCCALDRYIVAEPDVPALLASALAAAVPPLVGADPAIAPRVALSLYLDTEQVDPLQIGPGDIYPSIVTPVRDFMVELGAALAGRAFPDALIVVDTYPGSWGAPWFETPDRIVHHFDPATHRVVRVDPVAAADAVIARSLAAQDDFASIVGTRPRVLIGEVGWSTFDGDEPAQATFARRLFDALAAAQAEVPDTLEGFIWFKSHDRVAFAYPTWDQAANPLGGDDIACDTQLLGPVVCAAAVLQLMEAQWGLARADGSRKPGWEAFIDRWSTLVEHGAERP